MWTRYLHNVRPQTACLPNLVPNLNLQRSAHSFLIISTVYLMVPNVPNLYLSNAPAGTRTACCRCQLLFTSPGGLIVAHQSAACSGKGVGI